MNTCQNCLYWSVVANKVLDEAGNYPHASKLDQAIQAGQCRCNPPAIVSSAGGGFRAWPITRAVDWCGEWDPIPAKVPVTVTAETSEEVVIAQPSKKRRQGT